MIELPKCKLCNLNDADQTGSHILSALSVKSMIGDRGKEKGYVISPDATENYRKNVKADLIKEDYILCRSCEQRISYAEGYIASEFSNKIRKSNFKVNFPVSYLDEIEFVTCEKLNPHAFQIFLFSLIWRASLSNTKVFLPFKLSQNVEDALREILNNLLPPRKDYRGVTVSYKDWFKTLEVSNAEFEKFKFLVLTTPQIDDTTGDFVTFHPSAKRPYGMMLNEWIVYFDIKEGYNEDIFNLLEKHNKAELFNCGGDKIKIVNINSQEWNNVRNHLIQLLQNQKLDRMMQHFALEFYHNNGYNPSIEVLSQLVENFLNNQISDFPEEKEDAEQ